MSFPVIHPYGLSTYEENGSIGIRIFGLTPENENVFVLVTGFTPYIYLELPDHIKWTEYRISALSARLDSLVERGRPVRKVFQRKRKLYYAKQEINGEGETVDKTYPFLQCFFACHSDIRPFFYRVAKALYVGDLGAIRVKVHEQEANPILQLLCMRNLKPAGWFTFTSAKRITNEDDRQSDCHHEFEVRYTSLVPVDRDSVSAPLIMGFDIEVNSSNPNIAPRREVREDKIFQISCVFCRNGQPESSYEKMILSLAKNKQGDEIDLLQDVVGDDTEIRMYNTEAELLEGFTDLITERQPNILTGYNIFSFDLPYLYARAKLVGCVNSFDQLSFIRGEHCKEKEIKWSSSAFKNQNFTYLDAPGRLWVDMLPIIQRDYKLENYKLKTVSDHFLGQTKDPLTVKGIFKCYRLFTPESLSLVAKYCVKDSELVVKLFEKLQVWIGLVEMANTCNTPMFTLFTQGQQIKIFSQVYKKCMADNIVIDKDSFVTKEDDHFTGAYVFTPVPGLYDMVVSFDFSSLYPSTIIAYNIDYSTLVQDDAIPDEKCHIFEWEDHQNCACPHTKIVKTNKVVLCKKNRYRFLREPAGVIPTLLRNLIDMRKKTNAEMKRLKGMVDGLSGQEREETSRIITVLDKRQLAYKIASNSMYGGMGVKRGYLPFLPGAMCTTARGRESIEKASRFLVDTYGAKLIYGDSVTGDTPILVRYEDQTIDILRIDEMGEVWKPYEEFKREDSNRYEKQQTLPFVSTGNVRLMNILEVWTGEKWSRIRRVIRHRTVKRMFRVLTPTGCVDVTEDHSLLDAKLQKIKPTELNIGSTLYHSFPPPSDFLEIKVKDAMIEGKVYECRECHRHKLVFEFYEKYEKICKECIFHTQSTNLYVSETEYSRNPSRHLNADLAFVWGMFFAEGSCRSTENKNSWSIVSQDLKTLEKCRTILERAEPLFGWKILDRTNSVYQLVPTGHLVYIVYIVNKWRRLFYDREGYKKVPYFILNGSDAWKTAFFSGYDRHIDQTGPYQFDIEGKIAAQGLYTLLHSLGHHVAIRLLKSNRYHLHTRHSSRTDLHQVKKIIRLPDMTVDDFVYDIETEEGRFGGGVGALILKNTDSCYISFPQYSTKEQARDLDGFCQQVEEEMTSLFPKPMKFAYEEAIYWRYMILSKKRYMALKCDTAGVVSSKIEKRGVLLSRRDNSAYSREFYSQIIRAAFYREPIENILFTLREGLSRLCHRTIPIKELAITKSIGEISDYKIRAMPDDEKKLKKRLTELGILDVDADLTVIRKLFAEMADRSDASERFRLQNSIEWAVVREYINKALPSQVQLAEKMRRRGVRVDPGERLGYCVIESENNIKDKLFDKIEDVDYVREHSSILKIDTLYYSKLMINPIDEVLSAIYDQTDLFKKYYRARESYWKVVRQIEEINRPLIRLIQ